MPSAHPFVRHTLNLTVGFGGKWWTVIMKTPAHKGKNIFVKNTFFFFIFSQVKHSVSSLFP